MMAAMTMRSMTGRTILRPRLRCTRDGRGPKTRVRTIARRTRSAPRHLPSAACTVVCIVRCTIACDRGWAWTIGGRVMGSDKRGRRRGRTMMPFGISSPPSSTRCDITFLPAKRAAATTTAKFHRRCRFRRRTGRRSSYERSARTFPASCDPCRNSRGGNIPRFPNITIPTSSWMMMMAGVAAEVAFSARDGGMMEMTKMGRRRRREGGGSRYTNSIPRRARRWEIRRATTATTVTMMTMMTRRPQRVVFPGMSKFSTTSRRERSWGCRIVIRSGGTRGTRRGRVSRCGRGLAHRRRAARIMAVVVVVVVVVVTIIITSCWTITYTTIRTMGRGGYASRSSRRRSMMRRALQTATTRWRRGMVRHSSTSRFTGGRRSVCTAGT
mmetsp:Transcript_37376/g.90193  ORF Transcript_37376/g.90193 Transcript_37376/m.90193 type:complete len:383 (-) Transcript_37376:1632-2780(-)